MKLKYVLATFSLMAVLAVGCGQKVPPSNSTNDNTETSTGENKGPDDKEEEATEDDVEIIEDTLMEEFQLLLADSNTTPKQILDFITKNAADLTAEELSTALLESEELQQRYLSTLEAIYAEDDVQKELQNITIDFDDLENIKNTEIKDLLIKTKDEGYKLEQAEGTYYPIIDYSIYSNYTAGATDDVKAYFDIMITESAATFAKDAALVISYEEVLNRSLKAEAFLNTYIESKRFPQVLALYNRYEFISMHGLNNTPLFDYETNQMDKETVAVFDAFIQNNSNSGLATILKDFLDIVKKNNNTLNNEADEYRAAIQAASEKKLNDLNPYYVAGIDNPAEFEETFNLLKDYVKNDKKELVAEYIVYPINVNINGEKTAINAKEEFIANYDQIFNEKVKTAFLNQDVKDAFVNYQGVMVGEGELWFSQIEGTTHKYSIYGINN